MPSAELSDTNQLPISGDSHVVEGPEVFAGLVERFGDEAPRIANVGDEVDAMVIPARGGGRALGAVKTGIASTRIGRAPSVERRPGHKPEPENFANPEARELCRRGFAGLSRGLVDGGARAADQEADGVAAEVLYPSRFLSIFGLENLDLLTSCFRNYNDWIADYSKEAKGRLVPLALIPLHDPERGVAELNRVLKMGFRGACIPRSAPQEHPYRDPAYEKIWAVAEEAGLPLSMHIGTNATQSGPQPSQGSRPRFDPIAEYAGAPISIQRTLTELICQGVAHRHPKLKFVVAEYNAGWIANWLDRLDQGYLRDRWAAVDYLDMRPSEYWVRQFLATFEDDRAGVLVRELIGIGNLMWGSDYPHLDSTFPCSRQILDEIMRDVPAPERHALTRGNVARLYGME